MDDTATLNDLAGAEIATLERDGIRLTPSEIVEINALCWSVHIPPTRKLLSRGRPVEVGGSTLWPLTLRAFDWLDRNRVDMTKITPSMGYAMAFGRSEGNELDLEGDEAEIAVKRWYRSLRCSLDEYVEAVKQVDAQDRRPETPPDVDGKPMSIGDFSAFLTATCGADADFWERRCSVSYALSVLSMFVMQNRADKKKCAQDPRIIAERAVGYAIDKIRARHAMDTVTGEPHG